MFLLYLNPVHPRLHLYNLNFEKVQNQIKVLAQDSDSDIRFILQVILEDAHFNVLTIASCDQICEVVESFQPQVILMDVVLNGKNSIDACKRVKSLFQDLPIVAFSCNANINETYEKNGFDDYVEKPFDIYHLCRVLNKNIKHAGNTMNGFNDPLF